LATGPQLLAPHNIRIKIAGMRAQLVLYPQATNPRELESTGGPAETRNGGLGRPSRVSLVLLPNIHG